MNKIVKPTPPRLYPVTEHKPFVFIVPSYNNGAWVDKNLRSLFEQRYDNFRIIYIDDASDDQTLSRVQQLALQYNQGHRIEIRHNEANRGAVENIYRAAQSCEDEEILIICDGDDWLSQEKVLQRLNEIYADPHVWATYGSYIEYPSYSYTVANFAQSIPKKVIRNNAIRAFCKERWCLSHMRTFYAALFKKIELKDLLYEGKYFDTAADVAFMLPIAEMAAEHLHFVDDILYIYNRASCLNDHKVRAQRQRLITEHILSLPPYRPLASLISKAQTNTVQLVVFSYDRPLQLYAFLESLHKYAHNVQGVTALFRSSSREYDKGYEEVQRRFPHVRFYRQSEEAPGDFQPLLVQILRESEENYLAFAVDDIILTDAVDFMRGASILQRTGAYCFSYRLGQGIDYCYMQDRQQRVPALSQVDEDVFCWPFDAQQGEWKYQNSLDLTLYRKQDVLKQLSTITCVHPNSFEREWNLKSKKGRIGLCHARAKMVNIPLNIVHSSSNRHMKSYSVEELLDMFNAGLKIDIAPLHRLNNRSTHAEIAVQFINREKE